MLSIVIAGLLAVVLGGMLPVVVRPLLERFKMVDTPNERSSHTSPTYRGMGLATALAVCISFAVGAFSTQVNIGISLTLLGGMIAALVLGWVEDVRGLGVGFRAGVQFLIGLGVSISLTLVMGVFPVLTLPAALFIAAYINSANFMDGINGISGCHGLVAGLCYVYTGYLTEQPWISLAGISIAGAFAAFLPWNVRPGRNVFLGDAGSYVLGAGLASVAIGSWFAGVELLSAAAPLLVYTADTLTTLIRRMVTGQQWYKPHRTHVYQRLTDVGFSHLGSTMVVSATTVLVWVLTLNSSAALDSGSTVVGVFLLVCVMAVLIVYLSLPTLMGSIGPQRDRKK